MSMSSHAAGTPVASTSHPYWNNPPLKVSIEPEVPIASSSKCCKRPPTSDPSAHIVNHNSDHMRKRLRQASTSTEPLRTYQSGSPMTEASSTPVPRRPSSAIRDMSPPVDRRVPPINSADCCLGIVACDERGEIVGWTS